MTSKSFRRTLTAISAALLVAGASATLLTSAAHAETPGAMLDDTVITTKVKAAFVQDETVSALRINVTSNQGVVQLSGFANSRLEASRAADVARKVAGVKDVKNDIILK